MTLVVALIMLTVLTTIAITVANISTVDLKIVGNEQSAQRARIAAESGIDYLVSNPEILEKHAPFSPLTGDPTELLPFDDTGANLSISGDDWSAEISVQRMGDPLPCPRASLPTSTTAIDSTTISSCVYYEITSVGTSQRNASSSLTRGFYRKVGGGPPSS